MIFFGWLGVVAACAFIARSKGRSPVAWAGWGMVGGVIALGIVLLKPPLKPAARAVGPAPRRTSAESLTLIREMAEMRDKGILSPQEFELKKAEVLEDLW